MIISTSRTNLEGSNCKTLPSILILYCTVVYCIYCRVGNSLFCFCSFAHYWATVSNSLTLLLKKERPCANCSCQLEQISLDFFKKERHQWFVCDSSDSFLKKLTFHMFLTVFHSFSPLLCPRMNPYTSLFVQLLFFKEQLEWFALVALF